MKTAEIYTHVSKRAIENIVNPLDKAMSIKKINNSKFAFSSNAGEKAN